MTAPHSPRMYAVDRPLAFMPALADMDSGMFERNTATTTGMPTLPPPSRLTPIAADSGIPSSSAPRTRAVEPAPTCGPPIGCFCWLPPRRSIHRSPAKNVPGTGQHAEHDGGRVACLVVGLPRQLEGRGADQDPGPEPHDQADDAGRDVQVDAAEGTEQQRRSTHEAPEGRLQHTVQRARYRPRSAKSPGPCDARPVNRSARLVRQGG